MRRPFILRGPQRETNVEKPFEPDQLASHAIVAAEHAAEMEAFRRMQRDESPRQSLREWQAEQAKAAASNVVQLDNHR